MRHAFLRSWTPLLVTLAMLTAAGADEARLALAVEAHGRDYAILAEALAMEAVPASTAVDQPATPERELVALAAGVRRQDPYLGAWLRDRHLAFMAGLAGSEAQRRSWDSDTSASGIRGIDEHLAACETFAYYVLSSDVRFNQQWMGLPFPPVVDPLSQGDRPGPRHDATYIALLETMVFEPLSGAEDAGLSGVPALHARAAWCRLAAWYVVAYAGPADDRLRRLAAQVLGNGLSAPRLPAMVRAIWLETLAAVIVDTKSGVELAETWIGSGEPFMTVAAAKAMFVLGRRADAGPFRPRLEAALRATAERAGEPVAACLRRLLELAPVASWDRRPN